MVSMVEDPFAVLELAAESASIPELCDAVAAVDAAEKTQQESETFSTPIPCPNGSLFVFDLETVPDESRFPRPERVERVVKPDAKIDLNTLSETSVANIKSKLPLLSEAQLLKLADIEAASKKPRSGVRDAISEQIAIDNMDPNEAALAEWKKLSFNVFCCRIVALGIKSAKHEVTMIAKTEEEERKLINTLWMHIEKFRLRCGYNITAFDDAVLIYRSMILGIDATQKLSRSKFGNKQSIDLMTVMFPAGPAQRLKEVCKMLGIVPLAGYEMSGDKVFDLVEAGDWDGIANYVHSDALIEYELYERLSDYVLF